MNIQEHDYERIVAHVAPGMAPSIAHDVHRQFAHLGISVSYTENTVEVFAGYIASAVETWLGDCEHIYKLDRHDITVIDDEQPV